MLDLDSGQTMDPPAQNSPQQANMDVHPAQQQPYELPKGLSCKSSFLLGSPMRGIKVTAEDWSASGSDLRDRLLSKNVRPLERMDYDPGDTATYFFSTVDGTDGVVQLLALMEEPKGLRIRYKVLK